MIPVSDRSQDAFDNVSKAAYRQGHLDVVRAVPELWRDDDDEPRLRGYWLELMGSTGWRTLELLSAAGAIDHSQFVGVDLESDRIEHYRSQYPRALWLSGNVLDLVNRVELQETSVVDYDGYDAVDSPRLHHVAEQLLPVLRRSIDRLGAAVLLWNADLDASRLRRRSASESLNAHASTIAGLLRCAVGPRRSVGAAGLLPPERAEVVRDPAFTGMVGAFEIYRGKPGGHRMACLRVVLR